MKSNKPVSQDEYDQRRKALMAQLPTHSVVVIPAAEIRYRNNDADHAFRQDSDFFYLTGFNEPDAWLVLTPGHADGDCHLFVLPKDKMQEIWTGYRTGTEKAMSHYQMNQAYELSKLDERLPALLDGREHLYYPMGRSEALDQKIACLCQQVRKKARTGAIAPESQHNLLPLLHEMRLKKSDHELAIMRQAAEISSKAHCQTMTVCQPEMMEYQLEAEFIYYFMRSGSRSVAYNTIVGGGANACVLHYVENDQLLKDGDLVLIDAGCELHNYAADITRTFPINGRFSEDQATLYQLVLDAQLAAIEQVKPGLDCHAPHRAAVRVLTRGLMDLGLLSGSSLDELIDNESYRQFYMHGTGHWLGLDVHDAGRYKINGQSRPLEVGMVLTVEPGLYIAPDDDSVDERWRGIGIRIEDNVIVTGEGHEVITQDVPKTIAEIEQLMAATPNR